MVKKVTLPNGITLLHDARPGSGSVDMQVYINKGALDETLEELGLTFLTQEATNGGTATLSREQLAEKMATLGSSLSTASDEDMTRFTARALTRHAEDIFKLLADAVLTPALAPAEIERTKGFIRQWIAEQAQSSGNRTEAAFSAAAMGGQSAGLDPMGTPETLSTFTPAQVRQKHQELLAHPEKIAIAVTGDISLATASKLVADTFGRLPAAAAAPARPTVTFTGGDSRSAEDTEQTQLRLGFRAQETEEDRYTALLLQEYLSGGTSSPLFKEVRGKRGLVYTVSAGYSSVGDARMFSISAGAGPGNVGDVISVSLDLLGSVLREGVPDDALEQARARLLRGIEQSFESAASTGGRNATQILRFGRLIPIEETKARFAAVTSDDIRRLIARMMSGPYALAAVGPQETMPAPADITAQMRKQLEGVTLPAAAAKASGKPAFTQTAAKAAQAPQSTAQTTILPNGLKVVTIERPGTLTCGAWVGAGSDHETPELNGATHMNEHMMFQGTPSYGPGEVERIVEGELGAQLNAYTNKDQTAYYFYGLEGGAIDKIVDICSEMVFKADLAHVQFNGKDGRKGERDVVIEEIRRAGDNFSRLQFNAAYEAAYPNQPHGRTTLGTEQTLRAMTAEMLAAYRDDFYAPNNVSFVAVGPVKHEDVVAAVEKRCGSMSPAAFTPLPEPVYAGGVRHLRRDDATLCNIALVTPSAPAADQKETLAYNMMAAILGQSASSRFYKGLVLDRGLTSDVSISNSAYVNAGTIYIQAQAEEKNVRPLIAAIYDEIRDLTETVTQDELDKIKTAAEMSLLAQNETNQRACDRLGRDLINHGRAVPLAEKLQALQSITLDDVKKAAYAVLAARPTLATLVPTDTKPQSLPTDRELLALRDGATAKSAQQRRTPLPPAA